MDVGVRNHSKKTDGVSYLLRIMVTLDVTLDGYIGSCRDILITMQQSCNFEIVHFSPF